ncbi:hypothetical protein DPMN_179067 [Dreissena polymorpha]|uniref:Uncharacterized protein n=1 Tax=Dreissena polymorpha TaxID=45954 RepID=A0A9D4ILS9_DREPO|nr:hypothetical protein DPMN_179067 [Dreissena polymorpha]
MVLNIPNSEVGGRNCQVKAILAVNKNGHFKAILLKEFLAELMSSQSCDRNFICPDKF